MMKRIATAVVAFWLVGCATDNPAAPPPLPPPPPAPAPGLLSFSRGAGGDFDIWLVGDDGSGMRQLTNSTVFDFGPRFDDTGSMIYFSRVTTGQTDNEIWRINIDGTDETQVANLGAEGFGDFHPTAGFLVGEALNGGDGIGRVNLSGSIRTQVTTPVAPAFDTFASWSPDASEIAFVRINSLVDQELWVVSADGTNPRMLATTNNTLGGLDWHPDGDRLAAILYPGPTGLDWNIWDVATDGSGNTRITTSGTAFLPSWSPDGARLAFREGGVGTLSIEVANADGSNQVSLGEGSGQPLWSPDGEKVVFCAAGDELAVVNPDGTNLITLDAACSSGVAYHR